MTEDGPTSDDAPGDGGVVVRTRGLTKRFRSGQVAVDGIDLEVPRGAVYGFLGPNGSGKTTTIRMLLGLAQPTAGSAWLLGQPMPGDAGAVLPRVGALVEGPAFQPYLTGLANLRRLDAVDASTSRRTRDVRVGAALERVGLSAAAGKLYRQYSLGMKQRLGLAAALLRPRELLVLDEPTNGLDPQGTREVRTLVRELAAEGATVLVSSHLLSEIDQVCSHIGIMSRGRLLVQGEREDIAGDGGASRVRVATTPERAADARRVLVSLGLAFDDDTSAHETTDAGAADRDLGADRRDRAVAGVVRARLGEVEIAAVAPALVAAGVPVLGLEEERPTLEDTFVELTGEGFDVAS